MLIDEIIEQEMIILVRDIQSRYNASGVRASGKTINSLEINITPSGGQLLGAEYFGVLETGRKAGKIPTGFAQILRDWAAAKGITFEDEKQLKQFIYFVSQKIRKEGTALFRSGQRLNIFTTPITDFEKRLTSRTATFYFNEVINRINEFDKKN